MKRSFSFFLCLTLIVQLIFPTVSFALTSGPSQPEVQSFEPVGTSDMVDVFTGDFNYNIPLFELPGPNGGYPFNMAYHSGIGMDQEASWVGLGWNLNPGALVRDMRGLPDDFKRDKITKRVDMKSNQTAGMGVSANVELFGADATGPFGLSTGITAYYNNFKGIGYSLELSPGYSLGGSDNGGWNAGFDLSLDSQEGVGVQPNISYAGTNDNNKKEFALGVGLSSRSGLDLQLSGSYSKLKTDSRKKSTHLGASASLSFASGSYTPMVASKMVSRNLSIALKGGGDIGGLFGNLSYRGFYNIDYLHQKNKNITYYGYGYNYLEGYDAANQSEGANALGDFNREKDGMINKNSPNLAMPNLTYDAFTIQGQGTGGMFRPYRSEIGHIEDPFVRSWGAGGTAGAEFGAGLPTHVGLSLALNYSSSTSKPWINDNDWHDFYKFRAPDDGAISQADAENVYYKVHGEYTSFDTNELEYIYGEAPVKANLVKQGLFTSASLKTFNPEDHEFSPGPGSSVASSTYTNDRFGKGRMPRSNTVFPVTVKMLSKRENSISQFPPFIPNSDGDYTPVLSEYNISNYKAPASGNYLPVPANMEALERTPLFSGTTQDNHFAGFTTLNEDGNRYVYALPVYNKKSVETVFSTLPATDPCDTKVSISMNGNDPAYTVTGTDNYFSRTEIPPYAFSYMLSSVLGTDYVDVDATPGPSDGDMGYWVKFNYAKAASNYQWRAPYSKANYGKGSTATLSDDKASFMYGVREMYTVATVETKTHISVFHVSPRRDAIEAASEYTNSGRGTASSLRLDSISLYSKVEYAKFIASPAYKPVCIKRVHFRYTYDLCGNVENNDQGVDTYPGGTQTDINANHGKLTLKKIWFTYQNNFRGELSPYSFDYHERNSSGTINQTENPNYDVSKYDRWGNYRPNGNLISSSCSVDHPYTPQFNYSADQTAVNKNTFKTDVDRNAAVWCLKEISLPSGGLMKIEYESDDYAYVQHRKAGQMVKIAATGYTHANGAGNKLFDDYRYDGIHYEWNSNPTNSIEQRKLFFKLEQPIKASLSGTQLNNLFYQQYLEDLYSDGEGGKQIYFKAKVKLRDNIWDYVSGYVNVDLTSPGITYGVSDPASIDGVSCYTRGFVVLKFAKQINPKSGNDKDIKHHPVSVAAWQYMRTQMPDLLSKTGQAKILDATTKANKIFQAKSMGSYWNEIQSLFIGYRTRAFERQFANEIDLDNSFIRLSTPDAKKYGGGVRVKKISINDQWSSVTNSSYSDPSGSTKEISSEYGQVYDYTETVKNSITGEDQEISTGVAQYEPMIGGDEINLRHAKNYLDQIPTRTNNSLFFEYPANEQYYPGATVGYSKVTVQSLATSRNKPADPNYVSPRATTGSVEYQFYTAKEFPVLTTETDIDLKPFRLWIPIPLIGQFNWRHMTGTQGYAIQLNDMHGKLKSVKNYENDIQGNRSTLESSVAYDYKTAIAFADDGSDSRAVKKLDNTVDVLGAEYIDGTGKMLANNSQKIMGEEYEFFTDQRQSKTFSMNAGTAFNVEISAIPPITFPCPWPTFSTNDIDMRSAVTNKIIHKAGILIKTTATDGTSTVVTENKKFDAQTGRPLLTTVTNDYDAPLYNYEMPAQWTHENMGPAYENIGFDFSAVIFSVDAVTNTFILDPAQIFKQNGALLSYTDLYNFLSEGDEFIIGKSTLGLQDVKQKGTLIEKSGTCNSSGQPATQLIFHASKGFGNQQGTNYFVAGNTVKFDVIRSGKRNQLSVNAGSIVGLSNPTNNNTPADNRGVETSNSSGTAAMLAPELAQLFNDNLVNGNTLNAGTFNLSNYPLLSSVFSSLSIVANPVCPDCFESSSKGYNLIYTLKNTNCQPETCTCITVGRNQTAYTHFEASGSNLIAFQGSNHCSKDLSDCFNFTQKLTYLPNVLQASAVKFKNYWDNDLLTACSTTSPAAPSNLYANGVKGIWRPYFDSYYKDERWKNTAAAPGLKLNEDGVFDGDGVNKYYYLYNWQPSVYNPVPLQWIPKNYITKYNASGFETENRDILGVYSSALYGYNKSLPVAVSANAGNSEIYFENFDDPSSSAFYPAPPGGSIINPAFAHTGKSSLKVGANITYDVPLPLIRNKKYVLSAWLGITNIQGQQFTLNNLSNPGLSPGINLTFIDANCNPIPVSAGSTGPNDRFSPVAGEKIINNWQRVDAVFTTPAGSTPIVAVRITFNGTQQYVHFDDIRIFPEEGNMQSYVYDPVTYRLMATLDDNNYASFYYYDESGKLFLTKRETMNGIKTITESRSHVKE